MKPESSPLYAIISCGLRKIRACLESIAPTNRKSVPPKVPGGMLGERKMVCEWPEQVRLGGTLDSVRTQCAALQNLSKPKNAIIWNRNLVGHAFPGGLGSANSKLSYAGRRQNGSPATMVAFWRVDRNFLTSVPAAIDRTGSLVSVQRGCITPHPNSLLLCGPALHRTAFHLP